jgi:hypothetical protein
VPQPLRVDQAVVVTVPLTMELPFSPVLLDSRNTFAARAHGGSGRFVYSSNATGVLALADHGTGSALLVPRGAGAASIRADDTCAPARRGGQRLTPACRCSLSHAVAHTTVARLAAARIEGPAFVLVGNSVALAVRVMDAAGLSFDPAQCAPCSLSVSLGFVLTVAGWRR